MKIIEQTSNKLVCRDEQNGCSFCFFVFWGLGFGGIPLLMMIGLLVYSGVEALSCKRVEPTQVNCELSKSTFMGLNKEQNILVNQVIGAKANQETDSEGNTSYEVVLLTQQGEVVLANNNPGDASRIDEFVKNPESTDLTVKHDTRWGTILSIPFLSLFVVIGFAAVVGSIYTVTTIETYTFSKPLGKLIKQRKTLLGTQIKEYSFREIVDVNVEKKLDDEGDKLYQVSLLLTGDSRLILMPFMMSDGTKERRLAETLSQFIKFDSKH